MASLTGSPVKAVQATRRKVMEAIAVAVDEVAEDNRKKLELVVRNWKNRPRFIKKPAPGGDKGDIKKLVLSQGTPKVLAIFGYVDQGTEPHLIFPKKPGGMLAFNVGYSARTSAIAKPNAGTGKASGSKVYSKGVAHPGNEAREFTGFYALEAQELLTEKIRQAIRRISNRRRI